MKIVILTPIGRQLSPEHQQCVDALTGAVPVLREYGITCVDQARALLLERARKTDADVIFWLDDDIIFNPHDIITVSQRCHDGEFDMLGVAYARRLPMGGLNVRFETLEPVKFLKPGFRSVAALGFGFTAMKRTMVEELVTLHPRVKLGAINNREGGKENLLEVSPLFSSRVVDGIWRADDESFCAYVRDAGFKIGLDLQPRIWHQGSYLYGLEDSAAAVPRTLELNVTFPEAVKAV